MSHGLINLEDYRTCGWCGFGIKGKRVSSPNEYIYLEIECPRCHNLRYELIGDGRDANFQSDYQAILKREAAELEEPDDESWEWSDWYLL